MTYRPYPSPDRARHQLDRHADETPPLMRAAQPAAEAAFAALRAAFQPRPVSSEENTR